MERRVPTPHTWQQSQSKYVKKEKSKSRTPQLFRFRKTETLYSTYDGRRSCALSASRTGRGYRRREVQSPSRVRRRHQQLHTSCACPRAHTDTHRLVWEPHGIWLFVSRFARTAPIAARSPRCSPRLLALASRCRLPLCAACRACCGLGVGDCDEDEEWS